MLVIVEKTHPGAKEEYMASTSFDRCMELLRHWENRYIREIRSLKVLRTHAFTDRYIKLSYATLGLNQVHLVIVDMYVEEFLYEKAYRNRIQDLVGHLLASPLGDFLLEE